MNYKNIWDKTLNTDEAVEYEFSIGSRAVKVGFIVSSIISVFLLLAGGLGIITFLIALFYYRFYLKRAHAYAFTNKRVIIHTGWLSTSTTSIDYPKITDVRVQEPFFDRIVMHTGHIIINTAGTASHEVILKHIESPYEVKKKLDTLKDKTL